VEILFRLLLQQLLLFQDLLVLKLLNNIKKGKKLGDFTNVTANLAAPTLQFFPPNEITQSAAGKIGYNEWTRVDLPSSIITFGDLDKWMQSYNIYINTIGVGDGALWFGVRNEAQLNKRIIDAYQEVFHHGQAIPDHIYHITLNIDATDKKGKALRDENGQAVMPLVAYWIKKSPLDEAPKGKRKSGSDSNSSKKQKT